MKREPLPVTDECKLLAWRAYYAVPGGQDMPDPDVTKPGAQGWVDRECLEGLARVLRADRARVIDLTPGP